MTNPLRGAEIDVCVHHIALVRADRADLPRTPSSPEQDRRRREARRHRDEVIDALRALHSRIVVAASDDHTRELLDEGVDVIVQARLTDAQDARRRTSVDALIRVGRVDARYSYAPLVIKNHEVTENGISRRLREGSLEHLLPGDATIREGIGARATATVRRDSLLLCGAIRVLESLGCADPSARGVIVDRQSRVWWLNLGSNDNPRSNLGAYDALYRERIAVLESLDAWKVEGGPFPTSPYWHRECLTCDFADFCEEQLEEADDVSLTRFTSRDQQTTLREHGIATRSKLAALDATRARRARTSPTSSIEASGIEEQLAPRIERLDDLIYRARSHVRRSFLRITEPSRVGCPTADVEVDIDMESYGDATYLWGASVSLRHPIQGVIPGHRSFVEWGPLTRRAESELFARFWAWFSDLRQRCHEQHLTFSAYCFWAQAEDSAMNRAVSTPVEGGPTLDDLAEFRTHTPVEWIDLHRLAKEQIQTEGPLGLKMLATASGFEWRDENPSGEASMQWYEVATLDDSVDAVTSRKRILMYNEDDCRATRALREWLNGPARGLPHRDDPL